MSEQVPSTVRTLGGQEDTDPKRQLRELIYALALMGEVFTAQDVLDRGATQGPDHIGHALASACKAGLLVQAGKPRVHMAQTPEQWVAGQPVKSRRLYAYKGSPKLLSDAAVKGVQR